MGRRLGKIGGSALLVAALLGMLAAPGVGAGAGGGDEEVLRCHGRRVTIAVASAGEIAREEPGRKAIEDVSGEVPQARPAGDGIEAVAGDDVIHGTPGRDVIQGGPGNDTIYGSLGNDLICGGAGDDVLHGGRGNDEVFGDRGADRVFGDLGDDRAAGGPGGYDDVAGGLGIDTLNGGPGSYDLVHGDYGYDLMSGGPGAHDIASFATAVAGGRGTGVWASLREHRARGDGHDRLFGFEDLEGSAFRDTLIGSAGPNEIDGGPGDDTLIGGGGPDALDGAQGTDGCRGAPGRTVSCGPEAPPQGSAYIQVDEAPNGGGGFQIVGGAGRDDLSVSFDEATDTLRVRAAAPSAASVEAPPSHSPGSSGPSADGGRPSRTHGAEAGESPSIGDQATRPLPAPATLRTSVGDGATATAFAGATTLLAAGTETSQAPGADAPARLAAGPGCAHATDVPASFAAGRVECRLDGPARWLTADLGPGDDRLLVEGSLVAVGSVRIAGGFGDDTIRGGPEDDLLQAGPGADRLYGGVGADGLVGGVPGPTFLYGGPDGDLLAAGGGCAGGALVGGPGRDDASFSEVGTHSGVLTVSFPAHAAWIDTVPDCRPVHLSPTDEDMEGTFGPDVLIGNGRPNAMLGQPGKDVFLGGGGDDVIDARDGVRDTSVQCGRGHPRVPAVPKTKSRKRVPPIPATGRHEGRALLDPFDPPTFNCAKAVHGRPVPGLHG